MANSNDQKHTVEPPTVGGGGTRPGSQSASGGATGPVAHTGEGGTPTPVEPPGGFHIRVDRKELVVSPSLLTDGKMTGLQIRELPEPPIGADRDLFEIVPGGSDTKVEDNQEVAIREWMRFFSAPKIINPGSPSNSTHLRATPWQAVARKGTRHAAG